VRPQFSTLGEQLAPNNKDSDEEKKKKETLLLNLSQQATPHYNTALALDTLYVPTLNYIYSAVEKNGNDGSTFKGAILLFKVWLKQRGMEGDVEHGGFGGFLASMLMAWLIQRESSLSSCSPCQLLRVTLEFLAHHDFEKHPLFMTSDRKPLKEEAVILTVSSIYSVT
jgi:hypothetical protein